MLGQDRQLAHDLRQLAIFLSIEAEFDFQLIELLGAGHVAVVVAKARKALFLQSLEREDRVIGGDWRAIVPFGRGTQIENHPRTVFRKLHCLGNQSVLGVGIIRRRRHQRLDCRAWARVAFDNERVEAVERADRVQPERAALRRCGIHIAQLLEIRPVLRISQERQRMYLRHRSLRPQLPRQQARERAGGEGGFQQQAAGQHGNSLGRCGLGGAAGTGGSPERANHILDHTDRAVSRLRRGLRAPGHWAELSRLLSRPQGTLSSCSSAPTWSCLPSRRLHLARIYPRIKAKLGQPRRRRTTPARLAMSRRHAGVAGRAVAGVRTPC